MTPFSKIFGRLGNNLFQGAYIYTQFRRKEIPDIFLQDPKYFDEFREDIRKLYGQATETINKVAIHVRRGDYVGNPFYVDLSKTDYYKRSMAEFPDESFIVFSDDISFCKNYFVGDQFEFNHDSEVEALREMSKCKGVIMANSSFSWWASYLSNAKIIAPKEWYSDGIERTKLLPEWKTI